ncbi:MAG: hypothetical protein AAF401_00510 [Pseudomonadota bacterium]
MHLLEGALAFAVVMIIFSTIVTGVAEAGLRLFSLRQKALRRALHRFAHEDLIGKVAMFSKEGADGIKTAAGEFDILRQGAGDLTAKADEIDAFVDSMTRNPVGGEEGKNDGWLVWLLSYVPGFATKRLDTLTTYSLLQRFAKMEQSNDLLERVDSELEPVLTDIARTYERYVAASNEWFRRYAHIVTVIVALGFAFMFNIDASRLYTHLLDSPAVRSALIEQAEEAAADNAQAVKELRMLLDGLDRPDESEAEQDQKTIGELRGDIEELQTSLAPLVEETSLPIGPEYWPHCRDGRLTDRIDPMCEEITEYKTGSDGQPLMDDNGQKVVERVYVLGDEQKGFWRWFINALVAGVLIGLGGPFWYRVYASLSQLTNMVKGLKSEVIGRGNPDQPESEAALAIDDLVKNFRIAAKDTKRLKATIKAEISEAFDLDEIVDALREEGVDALDRDRLKAAMREKTVEIARGVAEEMKKPGQEEA